MNGAAFLGIQLLLIRFGLSLADLRMSCCYAIINNKTHEFLVPSELGDQGESDFQYAVASKSSGFASTWRFQQRQANGESVVTLQNLQTKQFLFTGAHNFLYTVDMPNGARSYYLLPKGIEGGTIAQRNVLGGFLEYVRAEKYPGYNHAFVKHGRLIERSYWTFIHRPCLC